MSSDAVRSDRRSRDTAGILVDVLYVTLIVAVPSVLLKGAFNQDLLKATVLVVLVMLIVTLRSYRALAAGYFQRGPRSLAWASGAFGGALLISSALSSHPWISFSGAPVRGIGAVTYLACLAILHGVYRDFRKRSVALLSTAFLVAHAVVVGYALIQAYGADPFNWIYQMAFGGFVSSTLANPNFSSAFVAITLPLLVRCQFDRSLRPVVRVVSAAAVVGSIAAIAFMVSFQAQLAALCALGVPLAWVLQQRRRRRPEALLHVAPAALLIVLGPVVLEGYVPRVLITGDLSPVHLGGTGSMLLLGLIVGLGGWTRLAIERQARWAASTVAEVDCTRWTRKRWSLLAGVTSVVAVIAARIAWPLVADQVVSGLNHRREMWIVGLRMLRENLLVGTGLETYFFYFSPLRPIEHAIRYEGLVSDNLHSVHLGMFSSGGLLLGFSYLALIIVVGIYGVRAVWRTSGSEQLMAVAVGVGWIGYHIQASVSIDMPGLVYTQWVLAGMLLVYGASDGVREIRVPWAWTGPGGFRRTRMPRRSTTWQRALAVGVGVIAILTMLGRVTAPLRADFAYRNAQVEFHAGNFRVAHAQMQRAIALEPRNGRYYETLGRIYARAGDLQSALVELERSALMRPGFAEAERLAGRVNRDNGNDDMAVVWYERALSSEPYGPYGLKEAAKYYSTIGEADRMYARLAAYEELDNKTLNPVVADVYEALGDEENAERVRSGG